MNKNPVIDSIGNKFWYNKEGQFHRSDGPAIEGANGSKSWYLNGQFHRSDGPAIERSDGYKSWYLNNKELNEELHKELTEGPLDRLPLYLGQGFDEFIGERLRNE